MARRRQLLEFVAMALVALVVAHNLAFVLAFGRGSPAALARSGHGTEWNVAVAVILVAGFSFLGLAVWRLRRLGVLAGTVRPNRRDAAPGLAGLTGQIGALWLRLSAATMVAFTVQENIEHWEVGEPLPGLAVLGSSQYPNAALVAAGVALAVAFIGGLLRWRRNVLIARIQGVLRRALRRPEVSAPRRPLVRDRRPASLVGRSLAVRAPPLLPAP